MKLTGMTDIDAELYKKYHFMKVREDFNAWSGGVLFEDTRTKDRLCIWHVYGTWHYRFLLNVNGYFFDYGCENELRKICRKRIERMKKILIYPVKPETVNEMMIKIKKEIADEEALADI